MNLLSKSLLTFSFLFSTTNLWAQTVTKSPEELCMAEGKTFEQCQEIIASKSSGQSCSTAFKEWRDTVSKNGDACKSFTGGSNDVSCQDAVNKCKSQTSSAFGQTGATKDESIDSIINTALGIANQYSNTNNTSTSTAQKSCYSFVNKDIRQAKKDHEKNIQEIKDKIKKAQEKINDDNKKLSEKSAEIKKDQTQLNNDLSKSKQEIEVKKREKFTAINEEIQKNSTNIRNLGNQVIKEKRSLEKVKFDHQNAMLQYASDKIDSQCKTAIAQAKKCFVRNSKGKASTTANDPCNNEVYAFSGKGASGTTALKKRLVEFANACYENLNTTASTKRYEYADKVKEYDLKISEYQEQINDANKALDLKNQEFTSVTKEFETELTNTEKNITEQITNLTTELSQFQTDINKSIETSNAEMKDLNDQLVKLQAVSVVDDLGITTGTQTTKDELDFTFSEAEKAIEENEMARAAAENACGCNPLPEVKSKDAKDQKTVVTKNAQQCNMLIQNAYAKTVIKSDKNKGKKSDKKTEADTKN